MVLLKTINTTMNLSLDISLFVIFFKNYEEAGQILTKPFRKSGHTSGIVGPPYIEGAFGF